MNELGNNIARCRKEKGISQEKLAEYMEISRQAVTKWESGANKPSTENLLKLSELFEVNVENLLGVDSLLETNMNSMEKNQDVISMGKAPGIWCMISVLCVVAYALYGILSETMQLGTLICLVVIAFPVQLFINLYFTNAIHNGDYHNIAGFDSKVNYNINEVKRLLVNINQHLGMTSTIYIFLICIGSYSNVAKIDITGILMFFYVIEVVGTIILLNYHSIDRIYIDEKDVKVAKCTFPVTISYLLLLLIGTVMFFSMFYLKGIQNNTMPAFALSGILVLGIVFATSGYFMESKKIRNGDFLRERVRLSKSVKACYLVAVVCFASMFFVG